MKRVLLTVVVGLVAVLIHAHQAARGVLAVTYAPGWNLVAGPEGSRLSGASGSIYTLRAGDTDYESFPANAVLHGGYGYWAFFPTGGSITFGNGPTTFTVTPVPGQYVIIGNPGTAEARITGADQVMLYTPSGGYQSSTTIPPGQGAWLLGTDAVTVTASSESAPVAANPPAARRAAGTREDPVPIGTTVDLGDGWEVTVLSFISDATQRVLSENQFNHKPANGEQFLIANIKATYRGLNSSMFDGGYRLRTVGAAAVTYSTFGIAAVSSRATFRVQRHSPEVPLQGTSVGQSPRATPTPW